MAESTGISALALVLALVPTGITTIGWLATYWVQRKIGERQNELQLLSSEHDTRFVYLHKRRADVLDKLYKYIDRIVSELQASTRQTRFEGELSQQDYSIRATREYHLLVEHYYENKPYLDQDMCAQMESFLRHLLTVLLKIGSSSTLEPLLQLDHAPRHVGELHWENIEQVRNIVSKELVPIQHHIEDQIRELLGSNAKKNQKSDARVCRARIR
jgi:hypothetical protein